MELFFVFVMGAVIGSFLNVCIYRLPLGKSIVYPGSHCPHCGTGICWYNNIPIVSYIFLMGRCAHCKKRISPRYPLVELMAALGITALYVTFGIHPKFFVYSALMSALIVSSFIDLKINEIPDEITLGGLAAAIIVAPVFPQLFDTASRLSALGASLLGMVAGGGAIYLMGVLGKVAFKKEAMGGGDVKLMAMVGAVIGWKLALFTFFVAPFFGAGVGIFLKVSEGRETIPYGPYLSLACVLAIFFGNEIIRRLFFGI